MAPGSPNAWSMSDRPGVPSGGADPDIKEETGDRSKGNEMTQEMIRDVATAIVGDVGAERLTGIVRRRHDLPRADMVERGRE